jgi:antitoxin component YwqK of YwqJK toxin-antitoxin module
MYTRGIENGRKIEYYDCGSKKLNANYIDGVIDGIYEEWDHVGRLIVRKTYFKGRVFAVKYL